MSKYGKFSDFCRDSGNRFSTIPVCNLFNESPARSGSGASGFGGCDLRGISLSNGRELANLGSILVDGIAILITLALLFFSNRKRAAVGRREMQYFLFGFLIISICEIFTIGGFPLNGGVRRAFTAIHIAAVVATAWVLLLNAIVGFQIMEDGTPLSLALIIGSSLAFIIGVGYIALDTGFRWTGYWDDTLVAPNKAYALYTLYLLAPLVFIFFYFVLETYLVVAILGERRPLLYLLAAALLFAIGQIFQFVVSVHICNGANGKINGGMFESLFTLLSVVMIWVFWSSITEDDWPTTDSEDIAAPSKDCDRNQNGTVRKEFVRRRRTGTGRIEHLLTMRAKRHGGWWNGSGQTQLRTSENNESSSTKISSRAEADAHEMDDLPASDRPLPNSQVTLQVDGCAEEARLPSSHTVVAQAHDLVVLLANENQSDQISTLSAESWNPPALPPDPIFIQTVFQQALFNETKPANIPLPPPTPDEHRPIPDPFYPNPGTRTPSGQPPSPQLPPPLTDSRWPPDLYLTDVPTQLQDIYPRMETGTAWRISSQIFEPQANSTATRTVNDPLTIQMRSSPTSGIAIQPLTNGMRSAGEASMIESLFHWSRHRTSDGAPPPGQVSHTPDSLPSIGERRTQWWHEHAGGRSVSDESTEASLGERRWPRWWRRSSMTSRTSVAARSQLLPRSRVRTPPPPPVLPPLPMHESGSSEHQDYEWVDPDEIGIAL